jgi:hypothetical protein
MPEDRGGLGPDQAGQQLVLPCRRQPGQPFLQVACDPAAARACRQGSRELPDLGQVASERHLEQVGRAGGVRE